MAKTVQELKAEAAKLIEQAKTQEREERITARKAAQEKRAREEKAFRDRLYSEIGQGIAGLNEKQHALVYVKAWEDGHASGYEEVEQHYGELADLAREILDAN
jgi:hypothetical protein